VRWPELSDGDLQRLRALPFWAEAVSSERTAGARVHAMAEVERDQLLREAIAMQAYEESRHAALLESISRTTAFLPAARGAPARRGVGLPADGYGSASTPSRLRALRLAADSGIFPGPLVQRFDGVMQRRRATSLLHQLGGVPPAPSTVPQEGPLPGAPRPRHLAPGARAREDGAPAAWRGRGRRLHHAGARVDRRRDAQDARRDVLSENERRLAGYDPRLLRPRLVPRLAAGAPPGPRGKNGAPAA